ncbi:hypothetical protein M3650_16035 [Paenibacillus sp. MER TA 81-3]|uniref:hypothetical protein n=1 Tax=Paenibacillus sp. MER TA 81-3 TaxID=2939573 RepID=UPI00203F19BA|nr:hypothetical protein [Paenibacillus sp. MER TA 81-3]MCM3340105.1 hypothetical protein [Paenibacillus sp. MER TA 81-3]
MNHMSYMLMSLFIQLFYVVTIVVGIYIAYLVIKLLRRAIQALDLYILDKKRTLMIR